MFIEAVDVLVGVAVEEGEAEVLEVIVDLSCLEMTTLPWLSYCLPLLSCWLSVECVFEVQQLADRLLLQIRKPVKLKTSSAKYHFYQQNDGLSQSFFHLASLTAYCVAVILKGSKEQCVLGKSCFSFLLNEEVSVRNIQMVTLEFHLFSVPRCIDKKD